MIEVLVPVLVLIGGLIVIAFFAANAYLLNFDAMQTFIFFKNTLEIVNSHGKYDFYQIYFPIYPGEIFIKCKAINPTNKACETLLVTISRKNSYSGTIYLNRKYCQWPCKGKDYYNTIIYCNKILYIYLNDNTIIFKCSNQ